MLVNLIKYYTQQLVFQRTVTVYISWQSLVSQCLLFSIFLHLRSKSFKVSIAYFGQTTFSLVQGQSYRLQYNNVIQFNSNSKYNIPLKASPELVCMKNTALGVYVFKINTALSFVWCCIYLLTCPTCYIFPAQLWRCIK